MVNEATIVGRLEGLWTKCVVCVGENIKVENRANIAQQGVNTNLYREGKRA